MSSSLPVAHLPAPPPGPSPVRSSLPPILRLIPPLVGVAAVLSLAAAQRSPEAAAETAYLAFAAGVPLLAAGAVALGVAVPVLGTGAAVALAWLVPTGPVRGALVGTVAAAVLALAALDRAGLLRGMPDREGRRGGTPLAALLRPVPALGLAFGLQALLRADELLAPPSAFFALVVYVALPAVGALAALALARLESPATAALATAAALVAGPGFRPASVVALVALAAAPVALGRELPPGLERLGRAPRIAAALLLVAPAAWNVEAAVLAALAGCMLALRDRPSVVALGALGGLGGALALAAARSGGAGTGLGADLAAALATSALVAATAPAMLLVFRRRPLLVAAALLVAVAAALAVPVDGRLAAPIALAVAAVAAPPIGRGARRGRVMLPAPNDPRGIPLAIQGVWTAALLGAAALAGSYPWLRGEPLVSVLDLLGLSAGWAGALPILAATAVLTGVAGIVAEVPAAGPLGAKRVAASATGGAIVLLLAAGAHQPGAVLIGEATPLVLQAPRTAWSTAIESTTSGGAVARIVLDSALGNAVGLAAGTPVATVTLIGAEGPERTWTLHVGEETGEWAAHRPDLAGPGMAPAPRPWISWVNAEPAFYGHRYRAVLPADGNEAPPGSGLPRPDHLEVRLRPDLPPEVVLTIFRLELRP